MAALLLAGCGGAPTADAGNGADSSGRGETVNAEPSAESPSAAEEGLTPTTCEELVPEVVSLMAEEATGAKIIAVYQPKRRDHIEALNTGTRKIPAGSNAVDVLTCSGNAQPDDASAEVPITYGMQTNVNNEVFVVLQARLTPSSRRPVKREDDLVPPRTGGAIGPPEGG